VAERVVVVLEAVEVEEEQQRRRVGGPALEGAGQLGHQLAAVAQSGQRVGHRLLADRVVGQDLGRRQLRLVDEPDDQRDLILLEGPALAPERHRAADLLGRGGDPHGHGQRPAAVLADLHGGAASPGADHSLLQALHPLGVAGRDVHGRRAAVEVEVEVEVEAPGRRIEGLDRALEEDLGQLSEVELGREGVAEATDRRLQAGALLLDELEAPMGLVDALAAVASEQPEQEDEGEHEEDHVVVLSRRDARQEPERRERGVDRPHEADDPDLEAQVGHHAGQAHPHHAAGQVDDATGGERGGQERQPAEADERRPGGQQHRGGPDRMPRVRDGGEQPARGHPAEPPVDGVADDQADAHGQRHRGRREREQHRDEDERGGHDVPGAHRELDPPDQRVDADQQDDEVPVEPGQAAPQDQAGCGGQEQRPRCDVDGQLPLGSPALPVLPAALEQLLGR